MDLTPQTLLNKEDLDACYWRALRRLAILFNAGKVYGCTKNLSALSDDEIADVFGKNGLNQKLVKFSLDQTQHSSPETMQDTDDVRAEHEFYGRFQFQVRRNPKRLHIICRTTEAFRDWSWERLHMPARSLPDIAEKIENNPKQALLEAFTNYLVKNFLHNMTHLWLQEINELNFHNFGGDARHESDFVADNVATIMLLRAYGASVTVKGRTPSIKVQDRLRYLFAMNRCNRVFHERVLRRQETMNALEGFQERAWRFKRRLTNQLSMDLLIHGAGAADIAVYFTGHIKARTGDARGGYYHDGKVVVRVNGVYFNSGQAPFLEGPTEDMTDERKKAVQRRLEERLDEIVTATRVFYRTKLSQESRLRAYAHASLVALEERVISW